MALVWCSVMSNILKKIRLNWKLKVSNTAEITLLRVEYASGNW